MSFAKIFAASGTYASARRPCVRATCWNLAQTRHWKRMAARSQALTRQHFGRTMRLFAPLYLSNECINNCKYCGFSRDNPDPARHAAGRAGRRGGAAPCRRGVSATCCSSRASIRSSFPTATWKRACAPSAQEAGVPGGVAGGRPDGNATSTGRWSRPARRDWSFTRKPTIAPLTTNCTPPGRSAISTGGWTARSARTRPGSGGWASGALFGLADWREEALALAAHVDYLLRHCWKAHVTVSLPRLRPAAGGFAPRHPLGDRELVQLLCALRLTFPQVGLVLSTREAPALRDCADSARASRP